MEESLSGDGVRGAFEQPITFGVSSSCMMETLIVSKSNRRNKSKPRPSQGVKDHATPPLAQTQEQAGPAQDPRRKPPETPRRMLLATISTVAISVIGVVSGVYALTPSLLIEPSALMNPKDPYSGSFVITNRNQYGHINVEAACVGGVWENQELKIVDSPNAMSGYRDPVPRLGPDEQMSVKCNQVYDLEGNEAGEPIQPQAGSRPFDYFEIHIRVNYHPWFFPLKRIQELRRFVTVRRENGFQWAPQPLSQSSQAKSFKTGNGYTLINKTSEPLKVRVKTVRIFPSK